MRKLLTIAVALVAMAVPATASASTSGAERAVKREVMWDYGPKQGFLIDCYSAGRNRYSCTFDFLMGDWRDGNTVVNGRARVTQRGSRYSVDYRVYS